MEEHAKLDRDMFAVRWVTLGLRVDVNCAPKGLMMSMVPLASFTIGGNWVINADTLKTIAPGVRFFLSFFLYFSLFFLLSLSLSVSLTLLLSCSLALLLSCSLTL